MRPPIVPFEEGLPHAAAILKRGGVVAFPTETVYGLGASLESLDGLKRIYEIKGRSWGEPLIALLDHASRLDQVVRDCPEFVSEMAASGWPDAFTAILPAKPGLPGPFIKEERCAVRITAHSGARNLIRLVDAPISGTSANPSGQPPALTAVEASRLPVDMVLDGGSAPTTRPSTLALATESGWEIVRSGASSPECPPLQSLPGWTKTMIPSIDGWVLQPEKGYRFSVDSILLAHFTLPLVQGMERAADLGSGTGVLSMILSKRTNLKRIDAVEIMEEYHDAMNTAVKAQRLSHVIDPVCGDIGRSKHFLPGNCYDLVIVNPPYYKSGSGRISPRKSKATANSEAVAPLAVFLDESKRILRQGGLLTIIIPENRLQETLSLSEKLSLHLAYMQPIYPNSLKNANRLLLGLVKNRNPSLKILQPLHIFTRSSVYTKRMQKILQGNLL
ncbi:Sua5/YciO/YrdC/YwlC family protein [Myxococcota bacterium]|nr:Sua5/YciO/YrdC/YwlC family protein [Myxococcota bacterium]